MGADVEVVLEEDETLKVTDVPSREGMGLREIFDKSQHLFNSVHPLFNLFMLVVQAASWLYF